MSELNNQRRISSDESLLVVAENSENTKTELNIVDVNDDNSDTESQFDDDLLMELPKPQLSKDKSLSSGSSTHKATTLSIFFSKGAVIVLTDCLNQLLILDDIYSKHVEDVEEIDNIDYVPLVTRFDHRQTNYEKRSLKSEEKTNFIKLRKECKTLIHIINNLIEEIYKNRKFTKLFSFNCNYKAMKGEENELIAVAADNKRYLKHIRNKFIMEMREANKARERMERDIHKLKDERENFINFFYRKFAYAKDWQSAREEQNSWIGNEKEVKHQKSIEDTNWRIELENRAHSEITLFIDELRQDQQNLIEHWMTTYDNKVEELDDAILKVKMEHEMLKEKHEKLQEDFEQKQKEIEEYLEYKAQVKAEKEYEMVRFYAAVKIQAWWRGVMVRRGLGPYKKQKGKKGKGKGKDKGMKDKGKGKKDKEKGKKK